MARQYNDNINEGPGEHDAHLLDENEPALAECVACGKAINAHATRCHHCGAEFDQPAWQEIYDGRKPWTMQVLIGVLVLMLIIYFSGAAGFVMRWLLSLF